jgi:hypothetical protein
VSEQWKTSALMLAYVAFLLSEVLPQQTLFLRKDTFLISSLKLPGQVWSTGKELGL